MGCLRMPDRLRAELSSDAFGRLLRGSPSENAARVVELIAASKPPRVIAIGDHTLKALLEAGCAPDLGIFDRLTRRAPSGFNHPRAWQVRNPAGEITDEAVAAIKLALARRRRGGVMLVVEGEEDLLALPAIIEAPKGSLVIYGLPDRGMMVVTADDTTKERVASLVKQFERTG